MNSIQTAETIPSNWYFDAKILAKEYSIIFSREWQLACSESQLTSPGDTFITTIAGQPIVIIRQHDSSIKAFYNVCSHRAGRLIREKSCVKSLQCTYHGWVFGLDGALKKTREFEGVANFNPDEYGLTPVEIDTWMGLVFINLSTNPKPLSYHLDGIKERIAPIDFSSYQFRTRVSYTINCNWKVYMDNYLEGYHIPMVHPKLNKVVDYKSYKTELYDNYSLQWCPLDSELSPYGKTNDGKDAAYYFTIFPNILFNIAPGRLQTNIIEPTGPTTCNVHFDYFFEDPTEDVSEDFNFSELVQQEDILVCEEVQIGLQSPAYDKGRFSVQSEPGVHHFQSMIQLKLAHG